MGANNAHRSDEKAHERTGSRLHLHASMRKRTAPLVTEHTVYVSRASSLFQTMLRGCSPDKVMARGYGLSLGAGSFHIRYTSTHKAPANCSRQLYRQGLGISNKTPGTTAGEPARRRVKRAAWPGSPAPRPLYSRASISFSSKRDTKNLTRLNLDCFNQLV